jgi:CelD/BcsL family acetyltransferase involved in cellulose biosynthesis
MDFLPTYVEGPAVSNSESERQSLFRAGVLPVHDPEAVGNQAQLGLTTGPLDRPGPLHLETVVSMQALESLEGEYERLNRVTGNGLPFALHEWHLSWCRQWLNCNPRVQDDLAIQVMRNRAGSCVAIIPMLRSVRTLGPLRVRSFNMLGPDPALSETHPSLVEPGFEAAAAAAIQQNLAATPDWDWVNWSGLSPRLAKALGRHAELVWFEPQRGYLIDLPPTWEQLRARLKRNIRESLRHCYNSLKREGLEFQLAIHAEPVEIAPALERFFELHRQRAQLGGVSSHPDHFRNEGAREFLRDVCTRLAARRMVRVFELNIGGQVVASRVGFVVGHTLDMYYSGFDPRWARYSVTTTILAEAIKYAIACGLKSVDLSPGRIVSKTRWSPREIAYAHAVQFCGGRRAHWARFLHQLANGERLTLLGPLLSRFERLGN